MNCYVITFLIISILLLHKSLAKVSKALNSLKHNIDYSELNKQTLDILNASPICDIQNLNAGGVEKLIDGKRFDNLTIQFNEDSSKFTSTWILEKNEKMKNTVLYSENNKGFDSEHYKEFKDNTQIDDIFVNPANSKIVIFSDRLNKVLFISITGGTELIKVSEVPFQPFKIYFTNLKKMFVVLDNLDQVIFIFSTINLKI